MRAGLLRHKIEIEQVTETRTSSGAVTETWAVFATVRARVESLTGREYFAAQQVQAENQKRFTIRYIPGITYKMRIKYNSNYYDITSIINPDERNRELILMGIDYD